MLIEFLTNLSLRQRSTKAAAFVFACFLFGSSLGQNKLRDSYTVNKLGFDLYRQAASKKKNFVVSPLWASMSVTRLSTISHPRDPMQWTKDSFKDFLSGVEKTSFSGLKQYKTTSDLKVNDPDNLEDRCLKRSVPDTKLHTSDSTIAKPLSTWDFFVSSESIYSHHPQGSAGLVLSDHLLLIANWRLPFMGGTKQLLPFSDSKGGKTKMSYLVAEFTIKTYHDDHVTAVRIPFENSSTVNVEHEGMDFVVFIPKNKTELHKFERLVNSGYMKVVLDQLSVSKAELTGGLKDNIEQDLLFIPQFNLETTVDLTQVSSTSGVYQGDWDCLPHTKNAEKPDHTISTTFGISDLGLENSYSTPVHRIDVDSIDESKYQNIIRCDQPFIFAVVDNASNTLIFMGKYSGVGI